MFSYGSGFAATLYSIRVTQDATPGESLEVMSAASLAQLLCLVTQPTSTRKASGQCLNDSSATLRISTPKECLLEQINNSLQTLLNVLSW